MVKMLTIEILLLAYFIYYHLASSILITDESKKIVREWNVPLAVLAFGARGRIISLRSVRAV